MAHPTVARRVGTVEQAAPDAELVGILLPVPFGRETELLVMKALARNAGAHAPLPGVGLQQLDTFSTAEDRIAAIARRRCRVAPHQDALSSLPDAEDDFPVLHLGQEIAVAIAEELSRPFAELLALAAGDWRRVFLLADRRLVIGQAHMLRHVFRRG